MKVAPARSNAASAREVALDISLSVIFLLLTFGWQSLYHLIGEELRTVSFMAKRFCFLPAFRRGSRLTIASLG